MGDETFSDDELRDRIREVKREEEQISYERRLLHGRIDVVRSEILTRIERRAGVEQHDADPLEELVRRLSDALTHTGPPPIDDELAKLGAADDEDAATLAADDDSLEELPELTALEDAELTHLVRVLTAREQRTSARRQELHRELDKLRAEHVARLQERFAATGGE
jgi:anti-sigma-K factor RsiG